MSKSVTRREFLSFVFGAGTAVLLDSLTGHPIAKAASFGIDKFAGAIEVAQSKALSTESYLGVRPKLVEISEIYLGKTYSVQRRHYDAGRDVPSTIRTFSLVAVNMLRNASSQIVTVPDCMRERLAQKKSGEFISGPIGYVSGDYHRSLYKKDSVGIVSDLPIQTSNHIHLGPNVIVERFPGLDENINDASGGVYIEEGKLKIARRELLATKAKEGHPFAQLVYYIDNYNEELVLQQTWSHWGTKTHIRDTAYYWGAYVNYQSNGKPCTSYIVADKEMIPIEFLVNAAKELGEDRHYQLALADAGNGSSILCKRQSGELTAYGINGLETHLVPASIVFN